MGLSEEQHSRVKWTKPLLTQEERILKREKRKQSNRDSAKRSRLRKEFERHILEVKVEGLTNENNFLRGEMKMLHDKCQRLESENVTLKRESIIEPGNVLLKRRETTKFLDLEKVPEDDDDAAMDGGN